MRKQEIELAGPVVLDDVEPPREDPPPTNPVQAGATPEEDIALPEETLGLLKDLYRAKVQPVDQLSHKRWLKKSEEDN